MFADLVFVDGNVLTMNSSQPNAEAVAIKKDKIVMVGTNEEINTWVGKTTKVIKLGGMTVVPGFTDAHIHVADFGMFLTWLDLKNLNSIKEMKKKVRERTRKIPEGRWIIGHGWDQNRFSEKRFPTFRDLDEAAPDNPVIFYHKCGRVCLVNSKALEFSGVTKKTITPSGGIIEKDGETGELTGILRENATDLVWKTIPPSNEEEAIEAAKLACQKIVEAGVTSIHWIVTSSNEISVIQSLQIENKLPLRVSIIAPANILEQTDSRDKWEEILGVKVFVDGSLAARTAALHEPYVDASATKGQLMYSQQQLNNLVARANKNNFGLVIHAMGDQAIDMTLTAFENVLINVPRKNIRYRIEHASVLTKELIRRIKNLGVIVSVQPKCVISEFLVWSAVDRLGPGRAKLLYPIKTLINEGIVVIGGSDCPMEPLNPLQGIQAAVTRQYFPEQQITVDEALRMYTVNAAYASSEENIKGSIDERKLADLTILSDDPQTVPPSKIGDIEVKMTIIGGKVIYKNE